jgi:hypothetical protein
MGPTRPSSQTGRTADDTLRWLHEHEKAAVASDTWGVEVRPTETDDLSGPMESATATAPTVPVAVRQSVHG